MSIPDPNTPEQRQHGYCLIEDLLNRREEYFGRNAARQLARKILACPAVNDRERGMDEAATHYLQRTA